MWVPRDGSIVKGMPPASPTRRPGKLNMACSSSTSHTYVRQSGPHNPPSHIESVSLDHPSLREDATLLHLSPHNPSLHIESVSLDHPSLREDASRRRPVSP